MKFNKSVMSVAILAACCAIQAMGESDDVLEKDMGIRVSFGMVPGLNESVYKSVDYTLDDKSGGQLEVLFARRHWKEDSNFAWIWGGGLFIANTKGEGFGGLPLVSEYDVTVFGVMGQGGIALKLGDRVFIEGQPFIGLGGGTVDIGYDDGGAGYIKIGAKAGLFVELSDRIELGVELGYQSHTAMAEVEQLGGGSSDLELVGDGVVGTGVLAITF